MKALSNADEAISEEGILNDQTRLYLLQLGELLSGDINLVMSRFANLTALESAIPNPVDNQLAGIVTDQGLAIRTSGVWVLASVDSTPITS